MLATLQPAFNLACFAERERACRELEELAPLVSSNLLATVVHLLGGLPDPDQSLSLFARLIATSKEYIPLLDSNRVLLHHVLAVFAHSYWLGEVMVQEPALLRALERDRNLGLSLGREDYRENLARFRSSSLETDPAPLLARFKKREYVRICLRDILGIAALAEITQEISALTDVILEEALRIADEELRSRYGDALRREWGPKTSFSVLSLGKLGGNELNYSSDLDLLYLYDTGANSAEQREGFTRLAQLLTEILSRNTAQGSAFRIDLRLRPQGRAGETVVTLRQALDYYRTHAQDWELQALIKARYSAGDERIAREFIQGIEPYVYRANINFAAIETAVRSRERISLAGRLRPASRAGSNIKLDAGGIRDIEFLVQCLQRVYGGEEKWLRSGGTLFALQKLHDKGHVSGKDFHDLTMAYEFLRRLEHRLQLDRGQQTHTLPLDAHRAKIVERSMGTRNSPLPGQSLPDAVATHMRNVESIYRRIIHHHRSREKSLGLGGPAPASVREMSFEQLLQRIAQDSAEVHELVSQPDLPLHARRNLHRLLSSAMTDPERYNVLLESPERIASAIVLLSSSDYLTDILVRHPDCLRVLERPQGARPQAVADERMLATEKEVQHLRHHFRREMFAGAAADVLSLGPVFDSLCRTSRLAETAVHRALQITGGAGNLAVFALGRLGAQEFDLLSDADLLLVRAAETGAAEARLAAERLIQALTAYTREGSIFAVDTRLRPYGGEGELVTTPAELERYLAREAQPWEALTYTKLSFVAGDSRIAEQALTSTRHQIIKMAARPGFSPAVREMRERLERANRYPHSFKQARGGFYDIDFIVPYLMLREALLAEGNTLDRLRHLQLIGALPGSEFAELERATLLYRTTDHVIRLVTGKPRPELPDAEHPRAVVQDLVNKSLGRVNSPNLQRELNETAERVRGIFDRTLNSRMRTA